MSATMTRMMNDLRISLPGAIDAAIEHALGEVMWEFCDTSGAWTSDTTVSIDPTQTRYQVLPDEGYPLRLSSIEDTHGNTFDAEFLIPDAIDFRRALEGVSTLTVTFVVAPDPTTPLALPDEYLTVYRAALLDGTKARMMAQLSKPWTNTALAAAHLRLFRAGMFRARASASRKRTIAGQRWSFPQSFAVRRVR
jgi:hypothetical protein